MIILILLFDTKSLLIIVKTYCWDLLISTFIDTDFLGTLGFESLKLDCFDDICGTWRSTISIRWYAKRVEFKARRRGLVVRVKIHVQEVMSSNPGSAVETIYHAPLIWIKSMKS
jgi:hypothetical protein